jgi:hypothetical protein
MCAGLKKEELKIKFVDKGSLIISKERHLSPSHSLLSLSGPYLSFPPTPLSLFLPLSSPSLSPSSPLLYLSLLPPSHSLSHVTSLSIYICISQPLISLSLSISTSLSIYLSPLLSLYPPSLSHTISLSPPPLSLSLSLLPLSLSLTLPLSSLYIPLPLWLTHNLSPLPLPPFLCLSPPSLLLS